MQASPTARDAYVRAEVVTSLAHQVRALRMQRGWSQAELAARINSRQAAVSRLEDPSYGRMSLKTLLDLSRAFDTGLRVQFVSLVTMLNETYTPRAQSRVVSSFEDEASSVQFYRHHEDSQSLIASKTFAPITSQITVTRVPASHDAPPSVVVFTQRAPNATPVTYA